ncbi:zinc finger protein ztf-16 [Bradysia coprophila]|uniref:zinc finger protein ztf-16 n=1 Tax=Bradysia coprophila TaxID=38358 RepID=UPI00187DC670|nr:zinc finger protein ztf-16 [Bradysia coprophila]
MSGEPDSGTGPGGSGVKLESPINNNNNDDTECDKVTASNTNFESKDGLKILQCERCGEFETISLALLLVHVAQCNPTNRVEAENHNDTNSNDQPPPSDATKQSRKLFECDVCNMKFSNGANMRRHKMRHTGVKPYECRVCQKRFFRKDHLAEHFTTHTKTLPYHCPICNRGFQRQIAMRAHFQNEHVGQHDLVKTCPLCSYRAGTMKSLRVHFFNRHGIDLDNPGPNAPSSLLLALDPQNAGNYLAAVAAASAGAANQQPNYSDSGDSLRSADNATPPMHFLTPHVEISMADDSSFKPDQGTISVSSALEIKPCLSNRMNGGSPASPHSADSNSNVPSSSQSLLGNVIQNSRHLLVDGQITPSISLIPIKQEPSNDDYNDSSQRKSDGTKDDASAPPNSSHTNNSIETNNSTPSSSLTSLIKVSPLKSLLREDLKRRISARASNRASRNTTNNSQQNSVTVTPETTPSAATTSNGTITSTGPETELIPTSRKRMLQCLFCGIEFPDQTLYFLHKGCHSESNPWKCNICGEQLNNVYDFNSHLLSKSHQ